MFVSNDLLYYLGFSHFPAIDPIKFRWLLHQQKTPAKAYWAREEQLIRIINRKSAGEFIKFRNEFDPIKKLEELKRKEIQVVSPGDENYPESLNNIADPPICLYVKGNVKMLNRVQHDKKPLFFSIVGTRTPTPYGEQVAYKLSRELAEAGLVIVSGLARGIDTIAHKGCLDAKGVTIAVLGCSVDRIYPAENFYLYRKIIENKGAIVSEVPPGVSVMKELFSQRNRIISGLSKGVLVVEGSDRSGTLITARFAAEQGKDLFAVPGPIMSTKSTAPNYLIQNGAKLVIKAEDILEEYGIKIDIPKKEIFADLNKEQKEIVFLLKNKPLLVDKIGVLLNKPINRILNQITLLEIKGVVEKNSENKYQLKLN